MHGPGQASAAEHFPAAAVRGSAPPAAGWLPAVGLRARPPAGTAGDAAAAADAAASAAAAGRRCSAGGATAAAVAAAGSAASSD